MAVYDDQDTNLKTRADDDELRRITGVNKADEKAMEARAFNDAAADERVSLTNKAPKEPKKSSPEIVYKEEGKPGKRTVKEVLINRRNATIGGIIGLIIGGAFGVFSILQGPFQFIHMAQLLRQFHFANQEVLGDERMSKIGRFIRHRGDIKRTRMGILGNALADRIETRMNNAGIESAYTERLGYFDGYIVRPTEIPDSSELSDLQNRPIDVDAPDNLQQALADRYDIDINDIEFVLDDGTTTRTPTPDMNLTGEVAIHANGLGYFKSRKFMRSIMNDAGLSTITASARMRIMTRRAGITWHPIRRADRALLEGIDRRLKWREKRQSRIDSGDIEATTTQSTGTDADGNPNDPDAVDAENRTRGVITETEEARVERKTGNIAPDGPMSRLRASTGFKLAGGVSAAIGVVCIIKSFSDNFDEVKYLNIVLPAIRAAAESVSLGFQIMSNQDIDIEQLGFYNEQMSTAGDTITEIFGDETVTETIPASTWSSARSIQHELGTELTGPDIPSEAKIDRDGNFVGNFVDSIPGIGKVCSATSHPIGQAVMTVIDFAGGPISAGIGTAASFALGPLVMDKLMGWLSGSPINVLSERYAGAPFGNIVNYGARMQANDSIIAGGGVELSDAEIAERDMISKNYLQEQFKTRSFATRIFDPVEPNSLVAKMFFENPVMSGGAASISSIPFNIFGFAFSSIGRLFPGAYAQGAQGYDYGFPEFGFSTSDINNEALNNPFENAEAAVDILNGPSGDDYVERAEECFGIKIDPSNLTTSGGITSVDDVTKYEEVSGSENDCDDKSLDWLRIRFFIFDSQIMEAAACYVGDNTEACTNLGFNSSATALSSPATGNAAQYLPDCGANNGNAAIACTAINQLLGIAYSRAQRAAPTNPNPSFLDCSAFVSMAVYRTFGLDLGGIASVGFRTNSNFTEIDDIRDIQAGDLVGRGTVATGAGGNGHIGIVVSYDPATGNLVTVETDGTSNPSRVVTSKGLSIDNQGSYEWAVRYTGPRGSPGAAQ